MENASKALIIAGSVLLSVLIISALVLMFNRIGDFKRAEATTEDIQKINEYTKQIETFEKSGLYGSEILSLVNLIEDYNKRQADLKGYKAIDATIEFGEVDYSNFPKSPCSSAQLVSGFTKLENTLNKTGSKKYYGKTVEILAGMKYAQIKDLLLENGENVGNVSAIDIMKYVDSNAQKDIETYNNLKPVITNFKNRKFEKPIMERDKDGKVIKVSIKQIYT